MPGNDEPELAFLISYEVERLPRGDIVFRLNYSTNAETCEKMAAYLVDRATAIEFAEAILRETRRVVP
jgi:hypothetical protein